MHQSMAPVRMSSGPVPFIMTPGQLKSGLAPTDKELEMLFQPMFNEHLEQSRVNEPVHSATEYNAQVVPPVQHQEIAEEPIQEDTPIIHDVLPPSHNLVTGDPIPRLIYVMVIALKWIYKVKLDEYGDVLKTAFLNGDLQEEVFVSQPEGFEDQDNPTH
ncbi:hypothetical protein Tco_0062365, partial [Tanacetum coccineum]